MNLNELKKKYDTLQNKFGDKNLNAIYFGGCENNPDFCFVFVNPTGRSIAADKNWQGIKAPWLGIKNVWNLFYDLGFLSENIYKKIKETKSSSWTVNLANQIYEELNKNKVFITNLAKCTQIDARPLKDEIYQKYSPLFLEEIKIVNPKIIILFGNQVSRVVLNQKIAVSKCRKQFFKKEYKNKTYKFYPVYYPVGNGGFNYKKVIEDLNWIIKEEK